MAGVVLALGAAAGALLAMGGGLSSPGAAGTAGPLSLPALSVPVALGLTIAGAAVLDFGWPLYRLTVTVVGLLAGAALLGAAGGLLAGDLGLLAGFALGGLLGGLAAWPLEPLIRAFSGALAGLVLGLAVGAALGGGKALLVCACAGPLLGGALTFLVFRPLMTAAFAVCGAALVAYGGASLWVAREGRVKLGPGLLGVAALLAVIGVLAQRTVTRRMEAGRRRAEKGGRTA